MRHTGKGGELSRNRKNGCGHIELLEDEGRIRKERRMEENVF